MKQQSDERSEQNKKGHLDETAGRGRNEQDANADRGGTTDMESSIRKDPANSAGSGLGTKIGVTGSDFDGQVNDQ